MHDSIHCEVRAWARKTIDIILSFWPSFTRVFSEAMPFLLCFIIAFYFVLRKFLKIKQKKRAQKQKKILKQCEKNKGSVSFFFVSGPFQMKFNLFIIFNITITQSFLTSPGCLCIRPENYGWTIIYVSHHLSILMSKYICSFIDYLKLPIVKLIVPRWLCTLILYFENDCLNSHNTIYVYA